MNIERHARNVHSVKIESEFIRIAMLSDLHWDNPKTDQETLKKHLDYCLAENIPVMINGDFFCLMQGKGDKRGSKSDIRPEHNNARYLDSIVETAVEWFEPYKDILLLIGYGNHETAIIRYQETDLLRRFVDLFNMKHNANVQIGGYGGWLIVRQYVGTAQISTKIKYFHGSGGGGIVTKGAINLTRALEMYEGFDVFAMGHIRENSSRNDVRETLDIAGGYGIKQKPLHLMLTGAYKEEYQDGFGGWHVERGAPVKPIGGRILEIRATRSNGMIKKLIDSTKFPL
jgi:hypothetical protein